MNLLSRACIRFPVFLSLALLAAGCVKSKHELTLLPDGSGKLEVLLGFNLASPQLPGAETPKADDLDNLLLAASDIERLTRLNRGVTAYTPPQIREENTWKLVSYTIWFDDINQLSLSDEQGRVTVFKLKKDGRSSVLEVTQPLLSLMDLNPKPKPGEQAPGPEALELFKGVFQGLDLAEHYHVPGTVESVKGLPPSQNQTASIRISELEMFDPVLSQSLRPMAVEKKREIHFENTPLKAGELSKFRQEMREAKSDWLKFQQDQARRKALEERRKKTEEKN